MCAMKTDRHTARTVFALLMKNAHDRETVSIVAGRPAALPHRSWPYRALTVASMLSLLGCASSTGSGSEGPPPDFLSWLGASAEELQQGLGPPDSVEELPSNERVMAYRWSRTQTTGGYATSIGGFSQLGTQYVPERRVSMNCLARFTLGNNDRVRDIALRGNSCFADHR